MTAYTFDENIVSDLHKDARGFRPTEYFWSEWTQRGDNDRQSTWDSLCVELEQEMQREKDLYDLAESKFADQIAVAIQLGAADEYTAVRWVLEAESFTEMDLAYGSDYVAFHFNLPYKGRFDHVIQAVLSQLHFLEPA